MARIRWGRVILGALCLEAALILLFVPLIPVFGIPKLVPFVSVGVLVIGFVVSWLFVRKLPQQRPLHGAVIGILATLIYLAMCTFAPGGIAAVAAEYGMLTFVLGNALRIVGCAAGGFASRR